MKRLVLIFSIVFLLLCTSCAKKEDKISISFSTWGSQSEIATIKYLISNFEKENPDIKIKLIHIPDNYFQKLHLLIASNLTPDVMFVNNLNFRMYLQAGKFEPLNEYIEQSGVLAKTDFIQNSFIPYTYSGEIYAIPRDISNLVVYYNKDIFDENNLPYPDDNWDMEDFLNIAKILTLDTDFNGKIDLWGVGFEEKPLFWLPFLLSNGGGIISPIDGSLIINSQKSKEALQFYSDLRNKYNVAPKVHEQASLTTSQLFLQNKVAMHMCGRWCSLTYKKNAEFNWDVVRFPRGKEGSIVGLDVSAWGISSTSKHKMAAWKFIEYLSSDSSSEVLTKGGLIFPAKLNVANSRIFLSAPPENAVAFLDAVDDAVPTPVCIKYSELIDLLDENLESFFNGNVSVEEAISDELVEKLSKLLD